MKTLLYLIIAIMLLPYVVNADPILENLTVLPTDAYLNENIAITFNCFSSDNIIRGVKASVTGPGIFIPDVPVSGGPFYTLNLDKSYIDRIGSFSATVSCKDDDFEKNSTISFTVSEVIGEIKEIDPDQIYIGDLASISFEAKKNGAPILSLITFKLFVDSEETYIKTVLYDSVKGWVLKFDVPNQQGIHNVKVVAIYDRITITDDDKITIKNPIQFSITSVEKESVMVGDNISITVSALDKDKFVDPNFKIYFGTREITISNITTDGRYSTIYFNVPSLSPKTYVLRADLTYGGYVYQDFKTIKYIVPVNGKMVSDGKSVHAQIRFIQNSSEILKLYTDASGSYSSTLTPGMYNIEFIFEDSTITLKNAKFETFQNPVEYSYDENAKLPGVKTTGIYYFESSLDFEKALIEFPYKEEDVDEASLKLYNCPIWNTDTKTCRSSWYDLGSNNIDKTRNFATFEIDSLGAFAIGMREKISINANLDKKSYSVKDVIKLRGYTQDFSKLPIPNSIISLKIGNNEIGNITSDNNGVFTIEFLSPDEGGNYTLEIEAKRQPYVSDKKTLDFEVLKVTSTSIIFPETINIERGTNASKEILIVNTGQDDIDNVRLSLTGLEDYSYTIEKQNINIPVGSQESIPINFVIPSDAELKTNEVSIKIKYGSSEKTKSFVLVIKEKEVSKINTAQATGYAFAMPSIVLPSLALPTFSETGYIMYTIIFAAISFSSAFLLKRFKRREQKQNHMSMLFDIKNHIKSSEKKKKGE